MGTTYCSNCGAKNTKESSFCKKCGEQLIPNENDKNKCSSCGFNAEKEEKYCPECGAQLTALDTKNEVPPSVKPIVKKPKPHITTKASIPNEKKGGCFRKLGKVLLWLFAILIVATTILYFMGGEPDTFPREDQNIAEETIPNLTKDEKELPPIKVREANAVLTDKVSFPVINSSKVQEFNYNDSIKISLPPNFTSKEQQLNVSRAEVDPAIMIEGAIPLSLIDLTLNDGEQPSKPVEVSFKYDPSKLGSFTAKDRLEAFNWDKEAGVWVKLPIRIDETENTAYAYVDHFSPIGFVLVTALKVGGAYIIDKIIEEKLINDTYYTPDKNFKIFYSKTAILADIDLNTKIWKNAPTGRSSLNKSNAPPYIQSIGYILEEALKSYTGKKYGFRNPTGKVTSVFGNYQKTITVKIDSWFNLSPLAQGEPNYEKLYERIHVPTIKTWQYSDAKKTFAHELFHRIQAEYYGRLGMLRGVSNFIATGANCWWIESTAEYAAYHMAFKPPLGGMENGLGNNYLEYPINKTGSIPNTADNYGWGKRDYEYISSIWVKYLVDIRKINLEKMIVADASDYWKPEHSLGKYLYEEHKISMKDLYRDFSNWMVFSPKGDLNHYNLATGNHQKNISTKEDVLKIGEGKEVQYSFNMPEFFTSKLWTIRIEKKNDDNTLTADSNIPKKTPMIVSLKKKSTGTTVDVFIIPRGQRYPTSTKAVKTFYTGDQSKIVMVEEGELLCIMATQGVLSNGSADVIVRDGEVQLEIDPPELNDAYDDVPYAFNIRASNIPKEVEKITFEWDYNDGSEKGSKSFIDVSNGEASTKIRHRFKAGAKEEIYLLKANIKSFYKDNILATAEAQITVPLKKPVVFFSDEYLTGPPGATFNMEANALPENTYKFVWSASGVTEEYTFTGTKSGISPVINKIGEYTYTVKLYNLDNEYLASDQVTIYVEEVDLDDIDGIVDIEDEKIETDNTDSNTGSWVLSESLVEQKTYVKHQCYEGSSSLSNGNFLFSTAVIVGACNNRESEYSSLDANGSWSPPANILIPDKEYPMNCSINRTSKLYDIKFFNAGIAIYMDRYDTNCGGSTRSKIFISKGLKVHNRNGAASDSWSGTFKAPNFGYAESQETNKFQIKVTTTSGCVRYIYTWKK